MAIHTFIYVVPCWYMANDGDESGERYAQQN
jgi:hypothetical protein